MNPNIVDDCWNRIGVQGDKTCPELVKVVHCRNCPVFAAAGARLFDRAPPPGWVDEQTRHLATSIEETTSDTTALLIFRLADEWLALPVADVIEVAEPRQVHSVPHRTGGLFEGIVNIRGDLQLCVSLGRLLGIPGDGRRNDAVESRADRPARRSDRMIVVQQGHDRWVFLADEVSEVRRIPKSNVVPPPATVERSSARIARGVFAWNDKQVGCLDTIRLFASLADAISPQSFTRNP